MQASRTCSVLQPGLSVTGRLVSKGDIVVGGRIDGKVTGETVEVLEGASIHGGLEADHVIIRGVVDGHIRARTVIIGAAATVKGELQYGSIEIARGARIETQLIPTVREGKPFPPIPRPPVMVKNRARSPAHKGFAWSGTIYRLSQFLSRPANHPGRRGAEGDDASLRVGGRPWGLSSLASLFSRRGPDGATPRYRSKSRH